MGYSIYTLPVAIALMSVLPFLFQKICGNYRGPMDELRPGEAEKMQAAK